MNFFEWNSIAKEKVNTYWTLANNIYAKVFKENALMSAIYVEMHQKIRWTDKWVA